MPVHIVPRDQAPRQFTPALDTTPFVFHPELFPALLDCGSRAQICAPILDPLQRSWVDVVENGVLEVMQDIQVEPLEVEPVIVVKPQPTFYTFLDLPRELRLIIWAHALKLGEIAVRDAVQANSSVTRPNFLPEVCYKIEKTMEETTAVVIEGSQFTVTRLLDHNYLEAFLNAAPGRFGLIRQLNFPYFSRFKPERYLINQDLELAVKCTGLYTVRLTFHPDPLTYFCLYGDYDDGMTRAPHEADDLFTKFRLERLLDCKMLKNIIIEHVCFFSSAAEEAAEGLGELLKQKFAISTPKQLVHVQYMRKVFERRFYGFSAY